MSSWKDLYSEVKKRKMEALNKKEIVEAVEKHGKILAISGKFEKPKKVIEHMYASVKKVIKPNEVVKTDLDQYDVILVGCPGDEIPDSARPKINYYVSNGGWILTTDWALFHIIEKQFPGFIRWNKNRTDDAVVACQILEPDHPFLEGVLGEIQQAKWTKKSSSNTKKSEFRWWLENRSFPIQIVNLNEVKVLIASQELKSRWGEAPVLVYFNHGPNNGRVIHMISHSHLQKGSSKGKYASALILTNILDEKVSQRMGLSKKAQPRYVSDWEAQPQGTQSSQEDQWVGLPPANEYVTPNNAQDGIGLTGTSQIIEANDTNLTFTNKCEYCGHDFIDYSGKIYLCKECRAPYHDTCLNTQINEGICKKCSRILLW
jgi:hypothetical protein